MTKSSREFPYNFLLKSFKSQHEVSAWCTERFGERWSVIDNREGVWCCFWRGRDNPGCYEWMFANECDAMMFMLRWT